MDLRNDIPDVRFWTSYDYFMAAREARGRRLRHAFAWIRQRAQRAVSRIAQSLRNAGAQPSKARRSAA